MSRLRDSFPTDLLIRTSKPINIKHKNSLQYKVRGNNIQRRDKSVEGQRGKQHNSYSPMGALNLQSAINPSFKNRKEYSLFADRCVAFLAKKKDLGQPGGQNLKTMFRNIRQELKLSQKKNKREKQDQKIQGNNEGFLVMKSQIHQHFYESQEKMEFYRITRANDNFSGSSNNKGRYALNPFDKISISCEKATINNWNREQHSSIERNVGRQSASQTRSGRRVVAIGKKCISRSMSFHLSGDADTTYPKKLKSFLDFLFKINYSNGLYVDLSFSKDDETYPKFKMFIGRGNNSLLIKSIIKRRFWWQVTNNSNQHNIDFYWSQNKINRVHAFQSKADAKIKKYSKDNLKKSKNMNDLFKLNKRLIGQELATNVQQFIFTDGYGLPFSEIYQPGVMTNHLPFNNSIGSKKNLFKSLFHYHSHHTHKDPFAYIPKTYHIKSIDDQQYLTFVEDNTPQKGKMWIIKPGQNTNRGMNIKVVGFNAVSSLIVKEKHSNGEAVTYIAQQYIDRPLLYNGRKFDIRHYMLVTSVNGRMKGYWYKDGYLRTSSYNFDISSDNMYVHLTNDAIQKRCEAYEKYEEGNKVSYSQFQRYISTKYVGKFNFEKDVIEKMKQIGVDILTSNYKILDRNRLKNNFELLGLDFMIDRDFRTWLIEVNYNPCLDINCPVLQRIVPALIENTFRIGMDPLFPPNRHYPTHQRYYLADNYLKNCKYELIFDETLIEPVLNDYPFEDGKDEGEQYQDEGREVTSLGI